MAQRSQVISSPIHTERVQNKGQADFKHGSVALLLNYDGTKDGVSWNQLGWRRGGEGRG